MHGAPISNIIFMPRGSVVLELLPFKFFSTQYKKLALRSGLSYLAWQNSHRGSAYHAGNCFKKGNFMEIPDDQCWRVKDCVVCIRDKSSTKVDLNELKELLRNARLLVRTALARMKAAS